MKRIAIHELLKLLLPLLLIIGGRQCYADTVSIPLRYYHSDHLGSASWITNGSGNPVQHLQYMPYGEPFVNERTSSYNERFTFTGKERDSETGYSYFGARFYDSDLMTGWLSVDPLADSIPYTSPYTYCLNNPIKLKDPNGEIPILPIVWALYEIGTTVYDIYESGATLFDKNASTSEKVTAVGGVALDLLLPGGGYGKIGKTTLKSASKLSGFDALKISTKISNIKGFGNKNLLTDYFNRHGKEFNAKTEQEYVFTAKSFFEATGDNYLQYTRKNGDVVKYNTSNNTFGIVSKDGIIRTLFKPKDGLKYFENNAIKDLGL